MASEVWRWAYERITRGRFADFMHRVVGRGPGRIERISLPYRSLCAGFRVTELWAARYATHLGYLPPTYRPQFAATLGTSDVVGHIEYAAELGMAGIQYPWALQRPLSEVAAVRAAVADIGLSCSSIVCMPLEALITNIWTDRSLAGRARLEVMLVEASSMAIALDSQNLCAVVAVDGERQDPAGQRDDVIANLADMAKIASDHGVTLGIEPMVVLPSMMFRSIPEAVAAVQEAGSQNLGVIFDTAHVASMHDEIRQPYRDAFEYISLLQIADEPGRVEPGAGRLPLVGLVADALELGYSGLIDLEHDWTDPTEAGERSGLQRLRAFDALLQLAVSRSCGQIDQTGRLQATAVDPAEWPAS